MTAREYHKHLIKMAKQELDSAHQHLNNLRRTSHMDWEIEEAEDNIWAAQAAYLFVKNNTPTA